MKKKFANRKDQDIDNDGDVDGSDKFLHKRRKAISKKMAKEHHQKDADGKIIEHDTEDTTPSSVEEGKKKGLWDNCLLYTSPSPRDVEESRMPSSA